MNRLAVSDIHGQLEKLLSLTDRITPSPSLLIVGDLIDNSKENNPDHKGTIKHIRRLIDQHLGECLMGNHELNAIGWSLKKNDGTYCRSHTSASNRKQHEAFLIDFPFGSDEYLDTIEWFKTLPIFVEKDNYRAVHACWDKQSIEVVKRYTNDDNSIKTEHWYDAFDEDHELHSALETLLKGPEIDLPDGLYYKDKTGTERTCARLAWWNPPKLGLTLYDVCQSIPESASDDFKKHKVSLDSTNRVEPPEKITFIGHYTLPPPEGSPEALTSKVLCLDFNAAKGENTLYGYLFDEETPNCGTFRSSNPHRQQ